VQREPVMDAAFPPTVAARPGLGQNEVGENALAWMRRQFGDTASSS
jgi:hypothetical protein